MKNTCTILLIDDEPANLSVLSEILEHRGLDIMAARSGESGLAMAAEGKPDLILLDIKMPGMDGFEVCRRLKQDPATRDIPVIFATILADLGNKVQGFRLGAVDYIAKPYEEEEVLARVERHLELYRLRRELADKNAELEAFAHSVSHHLQNPLARMESLVTMLLNTGLHSRDFKRQAERTLPLIQHALRQGRATTAALLKLAEISHRELAQTLGVVNVRQCAERAWQSLSPFGAEKQAEIRFQETRWPEAIGYAPWIEEIWSNYLGNALKYGGEPPRITLGAKQDGEWAEYWVEDNGPGLDEESQAQLFSPFTRFRQNHAEGHGLGLSIVQRVVQRLNGEAGMSCAPGRGCRFYFRLKISS